MGENSPNLVALVFDCTVMGREIDSRHELWTSVPT
jgi:hypothetical protein